MIFLPGTDKQADFFLNTAENKGGKVVIIGPGTNEIAQKMVLTEPEKIIIIVEDYDSLITMRYRLEKQGFKNIEVRMMDYEHTDFLNNSIDIVYAQASVSTRKRNKIIREIKKILKAGGVFCTGELTKLKEDVPVFIQELWQASDLLLLPDKELNEYYEGRGFEILDKKNLSFTLKEFYEQSEKMLSKETGDFSEQEKSYHKKLLKKISHESNAYLNLGGRDYMGFTALIMRKA